jgi:hypothetical protein
MLFCSYVLQNACRSRIWAEFTRFYRHCLDFKNLVQFGMRILTIDIGTGTQDIYLYDSRLDLENGFKLVLPSPTMMVYRHLKQATRRGDAVLLRGVTMGGGPSG